MDSACSWLIQRHRLICGAASLAGMLFLIGMSAIGLEVAIYGEQGDGLYIIPLLGPAMVLSIFAMLAATVVVIARRDELVDWKAFIAITWLIPYFGICCVLGVRNVVWKLQG